MDTTISRITDKILPMVKEWQQRPLESIEKVTKSKSVFPTDDSLLKMLYLAMMDVTKKWTGCRMDWNAIRAQLAVYYGDRMPE